MSDISAGQDALDQLNERVRLLGSTLAELGWDAAFHQLADELPDARERLVHVGQMTEAAATKVLDLVDDALLRCGPAAAQASELAKRLADLADHPELGVGEARTALAEAAAVLQQQAAETQAHAAVLSQIMMAQDCQDLSGQVRKKVVQIISHTEQQLLQVLAQSEGTAMPMLEFSPLQGPQMPDKAVAQDDVDALMAALGF